MLSFFELYNVHLKRVKHFMVTEGEEPDSRTWTVAGTKTVSQIVGQGAWGHINRATKINLTLTHYILIKTVL